MRYMILAEKRHDGYVAIAYGPGNKLLGERRGATETEAIQAVAAVAVAKVKR